MKKILLFLALSAMILLRAGASYAGGCGEVTGFHLYALQKNAAILAANKNSYASLLIQWEDTMSSKSISGSDFVPHYGPVILCRITNVSDHPVSVIITHENSCQTENYDKIIPPRHIYVVYFNDSVKSYINKTKIDFRETTGPEIDRDKYLSEHPDNYVPDYSVLTSHLASLAHQLDCKYIIDDKDNWDVSIIYSGKDCYIFSGDYRGSILMAEGKPIIFLEPSKIYKLEINGVAVDNFPNHFDAIIIKNRDVDYGEVNTIDFGWLIGDGPKIEEAQIN